MGIKSFNKVMTLFLMLMLLGVSSQETESTDCVSHCVLSCANGRIALPLSCFYDCLKECRDNSPNPDPIDQCDLDCVTETCLDDDTDARKAKVCADECTDICKRPSKQH